MYGNKLYNKLAVGIIVCSLGYSYLSIAAQPSQTPLSIKSTVPMNLIITIDDTLNMGYTHSPEGQETWDPNYNLASPDYNGLFYNPDYEYKVPPRFIMDNGVLKRTSYPEFSFSRATVDGYLYNAIFNQSRRTDYSAVGAWDLNKVVPRGWDETAFQYWNLNNSTTNSHYYRWNPNAGCGADPRLSTNKSLIGTKKQCWIDGGRITSAKEQQNYSNWLAYYASRMNRVKTILAFVMADLDEDVRVTWQSVQGCYSTEFNANDNKNGYTRSNGQPYRCYGVSQTLAPFKGKHKADFYTFLHGLMKQDGEFNPHRAAMKRVNDYIKTKGAWSPYREEVGNINSKEYGCRPTVHLIATHGKFGQAEDNILFSNARSSANQDFRNDVRFKAGITSKIVNKTYTLPDGKIYTPRAPYKDDVQKEKYAKTLSDYAFEGWAVDARPDLPNNLAPIYRDDASSDDDNYWNPKNDPATWQHVNTYVLSVGGMKKKSAAYNLNWDQGTYNGSYQDLLKGIISWPVTPGAYGWCVAFRVGAAYGGCDNVKGAIANLDDWGTAQTIVDSWHAALNGRGQIYNAEDIYKWDNNLLIWDKIRNDIMMSGALPSETTTITVSSDSSIADDKAYYYETKFDSLRWIGMITQYQYDNDGNKINAISFHDKLKSSNSSQGPSRTIYINTGFDSVQGNMVEFTTANYKQFAKQQKEDLQRSLDIPNAPTGEELGKLRLEWLRGSSANEGTLFRERYKGYLLGDIVNNTPMAIKPPQGNAYYMNSRGENYYQFKEAQAQRPTYVYVGANDGMLHAFDQQGNEKWAFIPAGVTGKLNLLSDNDYSAANKQTTSNSSKHRFFVDGPLVTDDVYFDNAWHTVLVGTLGRGGQGLFALDVTNPNQPKLLWEYGDFNSDVASKAFPNSKVPGYILSAPIIGPLYNGEAVTDHVIFGNGYGPTSTTENNEPVYTKGSTIAIEIATGKLASAIGPVASPNSEDLGFSGVVGMKSNKTDYGHFGIERNTLYAGNLAGEIYISNPLHSVSINAPKGNKLLTNIPGTRIINGVKYTQPITASPELARVNFMRKPSDILLFGTGKYFEQQDSVSALTAKNSIYGMVVRGNNEVNEDTKLEQLQVRTVTDKVYVTKDNKSYTVRETNGAPITASDKGFYIDLPVGELVVDQPYFMGSVVFFTVMVMDSTDPCKPVPKYWLMALDPSTGKAPNFPVFDLNGTGSRIDNPIISGVLLESKSILQGGNHSMAVNNEGKIGLMIHNPDRVRINRVIFQGDSIFKN